MGYKGAAGLHTLMKNPVFTRNARISKKEKEHKKERKKRRRKMLRQQD